MSVEAALNGVGGAVLVVDDEPDTLAGLLALLEDDEHTVTALGSIRDACAVLERRAFHAVICDYQMPGGTGLDVLRRARQLDPDTMGILWTGRADLPSVRAVRDRAEFQIVPKSQAPELLLSIVRQAVVLAKLRSAAKGLRAESRKI